MTIDEGSQLQGYLVIDSTVNGSSCGGVRMATDLSPGLLAKLARVMTLKYGFVGLPVGGAKAGIIGDPEMPQERKREILQNFGRALRPFLQTRSYLPGGDLGVSDDDIGLMSNSIGLKVPPRHLTWKLSGFYTGITVFAVATAAARHIGLDLTQAKVAIEGFGSVGTSAAQAFWEHGIRVVAVSTSQGAVYDREGLDVEELVKLYHRVGSQAVNLFPRGEHIDKRLLPELDVDIFCPCAQHHSIDRDNVSKVPARIISPGANLPITGEAEQTLFQRGVLCIPDFVANCGGVLGISIKRTGLKEGYIRSFLEQKIGGQAVAIVEAAEKDNILPRIYAEGIAEARFLRVKAAAEKRTITGKAFNLALRLYRSGVIPYWLVTPIAPRYFKTRFR